MTVCGEHVLATNGANTKRAASLLCKAWTCETCLPRRRRQLRAEAIRGRPNRFLTLTTHARPGAYPNTEAVHLAHAWRRMRRAIMVKKKLKRLPFLLVVERTAQGFPHVHILLRCGFIDVRWISAFMQREIGAPIVFIREVETAKGAARYIAKYTSKAPDKFGDQKRYWKSKDWDDEKAATYGDPLDPDEMWSRSSRNIIAWVEDCVPDGWIVTWQGLHRATARGPP